MTLLLPPNNWLDRLLLYFGRIRTIIIPKKISKIYEDYGPYVIIRGKKEGFWKTLFRRKDH